MRNRIFFFKRIHRERACPSVPYMLLAGLSDKAKQRKRYLDEVVVVVVVVVS